ncbi:hypothetical protein [Nocardioides taihuensis]|uniref:Uncharacterized protein n=1 Tax=Nocardioides taihuensis TaxID=1835606 RepID=A0ABW0BFY0_9ACTN
MIVSLTMGLLAGFIVLAPIGMALLLVRGVAHPEDDARVPAATQPETVPARSS